MPVRIPIAMILGLLISLTALRGTFPMILLFLGQGMIIDIFVLPLSQLIVAE